MFLWVIAGIALGAGVALAVRELVSGTTLRRLRRELIAEAMPSALTGARSEPARTPELVHPE